MSISDDIVFHYEYLIHYIQYIIYISFESFSGTLIIASCSLMPFLDIVPVKMLDTASGIFWLSTSVRTNSSYDATK